jgi:hypothetical protein
MKISFLFFLFSLPLTVLAKRFANQYIEFDMPNTWECVLEGAEWVCQSTNAARKKEAIIIFAAKNRGPKDSIEEYQAYLKQAKNFMLPGGQALVSEPKYAKPVEVNGHRWIDSLHMASEIPGFYTRYMATVKEDLGVVVTFSVSRDAYSTYKTVFDKIIASIRVFRQASKNVKVNLGQNSGMDSGNESIFVPEDASDLMPSQGKKSKKSKNQDGDEVDSSLIFIAVGVAVVLFFILRRRKSDDE